VKSESSQERTNLTNPGIPWNSKTCVVKLAYPDDAAESMEDEVYMELLSLPDDLLPQVTTLTLASVVDVVNLSSTCRRLNAVAADEAEWERRYRDRWKHPVVEPSSWRREFGRRHAKDRQAERCIVALCNERSRFSAWQELLCLGEEVQDRVAAIATGRLLTCAAPAEGLEQAVREEAKKAVVALNESVVLGKWRRAMASAQASSSRSGSSAASPPAVEVGAMLLVELYRTCEQLLHPETIIDVRGRAHALSPALCAACRCALAPSSRGLGHARSLSLRRLYPRCHPLHPDSSRSPPHAPCLRPVPAHPAQVTAELEALAQRLRARLALPVTALSAVTELSRMLFEEDGFRGNTEDYYSVGNSLLDRVLATRMGIPISLSVLFAAVCSRVGVELDMIGLPGHFLVATRPQAVGEERVFVDVFHGGRLLTLEHCKLIVRSYNVPWTNDHAQPVPLAELWTRQLRNLLNCHTQAGDLELLRRAEQLLLTERESPATARPYPATRSAAPHGGADQILAILQAMLRNQTAPSGGE